MILTAVLFNYRGWVPGVFRGYLTSNLFRLSGRTIQSRDNNLLPNAWGGGRLDSTPFLGRGGRDGGQNNSLKNRLLWYFTCRLQCTLYRYTVHPKLTDE